MASINSVKTGTAKKSKPGSPKVARPKKAAKPSFNSYNEFKEFEGKHYTGMKVGRSHKWNYDPGVWRETKITPDLWELFYAVTKRRAGHAPEGSGVPVGTGYHWYILAHQNVFKLNEDDYSTTMSGLKFKLAHKRAGKNKWSATAGTQRKHLIGFLQQMITQLKSAPIPIDITYQDVRYKGEAIPIPETCDEKNHCEEYEITLNDENMGILRRMKSGWRMDSIADKKLIKAIGTYLG
ncbi:MAG: hypothetical protein J7623_00475 [Chitinophaga sp.]|uniref:hypothetical protein n=1 Tax=Chitinophaga sp. TaxID=1869181 RepID=UPI001B09B698|nr:hypothetical protein [Chitinophaga sp.]MBO9727089.1 hypothetical protein [Chitinophaga sp.]